MRTPLLHASLGIASAFSFASLALAQSALVNTPDTEDITLKLGDIFEILPSTDIGNADTSWILTQDRTFIQADRTNVFRYRFIEPKTYQLIGSVQSPDHSRNVQRTFRITVEPRDESGSGSTASIATGTASILVTADPILNIQGKVVLPDGKQTVKLIPVNLDVKPLALDIDVSRDSDGNGSPSDDQDDEGTYFHSDATPLYVWLTTLESLQGMSVRAASGANGATEQKIDVLTESYARQQGLFVNPISFTVNPVSSSEFDFVSSVDASVSSPSLIFQWDFGDGEQSLLTNPRHAYGVTGDFDVTLKVRNLETGSDVGSFTTRVNVESLSDGSASSESSEASSVSSAPSTGNAGGSILSMFAGWMSYIILLIVSLLIGALGVFLFSRFRKKKPISDTFATMEAKILDQPSATTKNPPPLAIKKAATPAPTATPAKAETVADAPAAPKPQAPAAPKAEVVTENAPDWLKKGMNAQQPAAPAPSPAAAAPAAPKAPAVPQPPKPQAAKPQAPAAPKAPAAPQPPKPQAPAPTASSTTATPSPAPAAPAAPKSVPTPPQAPKAPAVPQPPKPQAPTTPAPQAAPALTPTPQPQADAPAPAWLKPTTPTPAPASAPAAPAVTPAAPAPVSQPIPPAETAPAAPVESKPLQEGKDEPIAFIRAESLNPQQPQNPSQS